jgi:hypothetical protein
MLGSPASIRKAGRLTTALVTYGYIFIEAEIFLVCHPEGLDAGLGIVGHDLAESRSQRHYAGISRRPHSVRCRRVLEPMTDAVAHQHPLPIRSAEQ